MIFTRNQSFEEIMAHIHAYVPVHEGAVELAQQLADEHKRPEIGELIKWENAPLKAKIGKLRAEGYTNIHVIGDKEIQAREALKQ